VLKLENIDFSYGDIKILNRIDFHLKENEFIGIIGPNGSGKSTLLKNISKLLNPDSGFIYLDKNLLNDYSYKELAKKMAVVPQDTKVNFNFSVYDLVMMGRNPYQDRWGRITKEDKRKVNEAMELTDTKKFKDKSIQNLSGG
jgi:iron complex transport system ATP-binding protein